MVWWAYPYSIYVVGFIDCRARKELRFKNLDPSLIVKAFRTMGSAW